MALPQTLGRLTLLQPLGGDTYTTSWLYHDPDRGAPVVVRALADAFVHHPQARADFIGGTGPFQMISSPQYAAVLSTGETPDGTPYVVAPYVAAPPPTPPWPAFNPPSPASMPAPSQPAKRRWPLIVGLVTALVVLVALGITLGLTVGTSSTSTSHPASHPAGEQPSRPAAQPGGTSSDVPTVGQCRALTDATVPKASDSTPAIACSQTHTAKTYYVGRFQGSTMNSTYAGEICAEHLPAGLGLTQKQAALTAYQVLFFGPTKAQWAAGQRWFRCDVGLLAGTHVLPLPSDLTPTPLPDSLAACLDQQGQTTPCNRSHVLRASGTYNLTGPSLPSPAKAQAQGRTQCPRGSAYFTWPNDAAEYKAGMRTGVCWSPDSAGTGGTNT